MSTAVRFTPLLFVAAACVAASRPPAARAQTALPPLGQVTHVTLTDAASGTPLGTVRRADSVAALVTLYDHLAKGWVEGPARVPEVAATFYRDTVPVATLALASGAFEARVGGRVLHRPARGDEALAFAQAAGVPVKRGPAWAGVTGPRKP
jgi:hypothetical protein